MTKPGKRITVARSVVTGIRIDANTSQLVIEGVDQSKDGQTLAGHTRTFSSDAADPERTTPDDVAKAIAKVAAFAQRVIDDA